MCCRLCNHLVFIYYRAEMICISAVFTHTVLNYADSVKQMG